MRWNLYSISFFILVFGLQIANLPVVINSDFNNKGTFVTFLLFCMLAVGIFVNDREKKDFSKYNILIPLYIVIVSILSASYNVINSELIKPDNVEKYFYLIVFHAISKSFFILAASYFISKISTNDIIKIHSVYARCFFILSILSLIIYYIINIREYKFIMYPGDRFAAFHYELLYFSFSALVSFLFYVKNTKVKTILIYVTFACLLIPITQSNMVPIFLVVFIYSWLCSRYWFFKKTYTVVIIFSVIFLNFFFLYFDEFINSIVSISELFPRGASIDMTTVENSPLLVRIAIHNAGISYFINNLVSVPPGISSSTQMSEFVNYYVVYKQEDATGITAFLADFLLFSIPLVVFLVIKLKEIERLINVNSFKYLTIINFSIFVIVFHAGYLNFSIWAWMFISYRYLKLNEKKQ